jgi:hypothetical protein
MGMMSKKSRIEELQRQTLATGITWFRKEDYAALCELFIDGEKMPTMWEEWLKHSEAMERDAKTKFQNIDRIYLDPAEFAAWCKGHSIRPDSIARHRFVAIKIDEKCGTAH